MARILMACIPAYGLANPTLPFVRALCDAGHTVDYLTGLAFRDKVTRCGARLVPLAPWMTGPLIHPRQLLRHGRRLFRTMNRQIRQLAGDYDAVVACGLNPEISALERELTQPVMFLSPVFFQNDRTAAHIADLAVDMPGPGRRLLRSPRLRRAVSMVVGPGVFGSRTPDVLDLLGPQSATLSISPASRYYQPYADDFGDRCIFTGPSPTVRSSDPSFPLDRLSAHDGPVIYVTLGTVFNGWTGYFRAVAEAYADSDALVVITTGHAHGLERLIRMGPLPDNVIARPFVPQTEILERADLCFTHGGFGSTTDTVVMGVPAVLTPVGADHFFNAYRMQELDAGRVLPRGAFTPAAARRVGDAVLAAGPTDGLRALRDSFASAGGPALGVRAIEAVLAGQAPPRT